MSLIKLNQGNLLREAVKPFLLVSDIGSIECSENGVLIQTQDSECSFMMVLKINPQALSLIQCDGIEYIVTDLNALDAVLSTINDEDSVSISFHFKPDPTTDSFLRFTLRDTTGNDRRLREEQLYIFYDERQWEMDVGQLNFDLVVGINSESFRQLLTHLNHFGDTVTVSVTDAVVKFTVADETITLTKENEECIIGGAQGENPMVLVFYLPCMNSFMEASKYSNFIWLLRQEEGLALLIFPVWPLGNIMYLFCPIQHRIRNVDRSS